MYARLLLPPAALAAALTLAWSGCTAEPGPVPPPVAGARGGTGGAARGTGGGPGSAAGGVAGNPATGGAAGQGAPVGGGSGDDASASDDVGADATGSADTVAEDGRGGDSGPDATAGAVIWAIDNTKSIGGHPTTVLGSPTVIDTPFGKALLFDGVDDALIVEHHPLAGLGQFTVEVIFRPDPGGAPAQRFFHMQDSSSGGRVLYETRLPGMQRWVLDVFVESAGGEVALYNAQRPHPLGSWYNGAAVIDGKRARHYVNSVEESNFALDFRPLGPGRTSIGVRINKMYYFKGAIRLARFTPRALAPGELMGPE